MMASGNTESTIEAQSSGEQRHDHRRRRENQRRAARNERCYGKIEAVWNIDIPPFLKEGDS
jgi:hypothetical protein